MLPDAELCYGTCMKITTCYVQTNAVQVGTPAFCETGPARSNGEEVGLLTVSVALRSMLAMLRATLGAKPALNRFSTQLLKHP